MEDEKEILDETVENTEEVNQEETEESSETEVIDEAADEEPEEAAPSEIETVEESGDTTITYEISYDEIEAAVKNAMTDYYAANAVQVVDVSADAGINKPLEELTLTEVCLVIIVLVLLGKSILKIIGGKAWDR